MDGKITFKERLSNILGFMSRASDQELQYYKYGGIGALVVILVGFWYFLKLKILALGLFLLAVGFLAWVMVEANNRGGNLPVDEPKPKPKPGKPPKSSVADISNWGINTDFSASGIPDYKEYNRRLKKAMG